MMNLPRKNERRGARTRPVAWGFAAAVAWFGGSMVAAEGFAVRLRNDLTPGALTTYQLTIHGVHTTPPPRWEEKLSFSQHGRLTLVVLDAPGKGAARRAWMMVLDEPVVEGLTRDGEPVIEELTAKAVGLPPKAAQLRTSTIDAQRADAAPVGGSLVQRAAVLLALDFAHWPDRLVTPGETWESAPQREELDGAWSHVYVAGEGRGAERLAVGSFEFKGALAGGFAGAAEVVGASGTWKWRVAKRSLEASTARIVLRYGHREKPRELALNLSLEVETRTRLDAPALAEAREELAQLGEWAAALGGGDEESGRAALQRFIDQHPASLWLPVARDLLERAAFEEEAFADLGPSDLREALTKLVTRWQLVALAGKTEPLQPLRDTFRELTEANRPTLHRLAVDADPIVRTLAVFCVAFGEERSDLAQVVARCGDEDPRVRAWAAYGLAERRDAAVDPEVLLKLLDDADDKVRQRACMAVRTCVRPEAAARTSFVTRLLRLLREDDSDPARNRAAEALDVLAVPADLAALIEAENEQRVPEARRQLEATIRRLGGTPEEGADD